MSNMFQREQGPSLRTVLSALSLVWFILISACAGVTSKISRHATSADLLKGEAEDVVISSRGTIQLGLGQEALVEDFERVWSINSVVVSGGTIYVGTSPNGGIYKYSLGQLTKIYPSEDPPQTEDANTVDEDKHLSNEHIFAMSKDVSGRLLAGISGEKCRLCRLEGEKMEVIFEPEGAKYIFAIAIDNGGNIYLGTGPEGKVYRCDPFGKEGKVVYESRDKNILALAAAADGFVYAGSDSRGLVYKIDPRTEGATVLYDSDQPEITALLWQESGQLWAAATSANIVQTQTQFAAQLPSEGRPEAKTENDKSTTEGEGGVKLKIANTSRASSGKPSPGPSPVRKGAKSTAASHVYKVTQDGFVTDVFSENAVFFCLGAQAESLLVGTGNNARLFRVDPASEEESVIYEDKKAVQITAMAVAGDDVYLGTANPAKLIKLGRSFAGRGTYTSDLIDAEQPAKWGKLQIEADIPDGCKVLVSSRSGNVKDVNDPTFSEWTEPVEVTEPTQLGCPLGRFCQYKLVLESSGGDKSPVIREIAVASTVPNIAPKVESVSISRIPAAGKQGAFKISYKAEDDNKDKLTYKIDFRKVGRSNWIELKEELEADNFEWDGNTVEDGRYEVRVTASDERSNTATTNLQGSRVSEPVVVDNTGPVIRNMKAGSVLQNDGPHKVFEFEVRDELSAIERLEYTIDSNTKWKGTLPDDLVYDTTDESFTIRIDTDKELPTGDHVLTIRVSDAVGNTTYKTVDVNVE